MFGGIFLSNLFVYLVVFGIIMWKLEKRTFYNQPCQCVKVCLVLRATYFCKTRKRKRGCRWGKLIVKNRPNL